LDPLGGCITGIIFFAVYFGILLGCGALFGWSVAGIVAVVIFLPLGVVLSFLRDRDDFLG
jgi:hypothetical protein